MLDISQVAIKQAHPEMGNGDDDRILKDVLIEEQLTDYA